jgi:hypothetical protein
MKTGKPVNIIQPEINSNTKNIRELCRGIN